MIVDHPSSCAIGQPIYIKEDMKAPSGFINRANNITGVCEVVLFEPTEIPFEDGMSQIKEIVPNWRDTFDAMLLKASSDTKKYWTITVQEKWFKNL